MVTAKNLATLDPYPNLAIWSYHQISIGTLHIYHQKNAAALCYVSNVDGFVDSKGILNGLIEPHGLSYKKPY